MSVVYEVAQLTRVQIPDALEILHHNHSRFALMEFLRRTLCHKRRVVLQLDGQDDVALKLTREDLSPVRVVFATINDCPIPLTELSLAGDSLQLPEALTGELVVEAAVTTHPTYGDIDAEHLAPWLETLMHGTLARMYAIQTYQWFDSGAATYHRQLFDAGVEAARSDDLRQTRRRPRRVKYGGL